MTIEAKDLEDVRLSRPVSVTDLWEIDDRIDRLQDAVLRLERVVEVLTEVYRRERIKNWEFILRKMLEKEQIKKGNRDAHRVR